MCVLPERVFVSPPLFFCHARSHLAGIVGSVVLPILGAVPDGAIVLFSGLGPDAQSQVNTVEEKKKLSGIHPPKADCPSAKTHSFAHLSEVGAFNIIISHVGSCRLAWERLLARRSCY